MKRILITILFLCLTACGFGQEPYMKPILGKQINRGHSLSDGLVGCWLANEGTGNTVYDLSGNGNHATFAGNTGWTSGKFGSALNLPGAAGDYAVTGPSPSMIVNQGTIIVWFKTGGISASDYIYHLNIDASNRLYLNARAGGTVIDHYGRSGGTNVTVLTEVYTVDDNQWYMYATTWNATIAVMYRNAKVVATEAGDERLSWSGTPTLYIGCEATPSLEFPGQIDHILLYKRALTASEITQLYQEPFCMFVEGLPVSMMYSYAAAGGNVPTPYYYRGLIFLPILPMVYLWRRKKCAA